MWRWKLWQWRVLWCAVKNLSIREERNGKNEWWVRAAVFSCRCYDGAVLQNSVRMILILSFDSLLLLGFWSTVFVVGVVHPDLCIAYSWIVCTCSSISMIRQEYTIKFVYENRMLLWLAQQQPSLFRFVGSFRFHFRTSNFIGRFVVVASKCSQIERSTTNGHPDACICCCSSCCRYGRPCCCSCCWILCRMRFYRNRRDCLYCYDPVST